MHGEVVKVPGHIDGTNENAIITLCLGNSATFKCCARPYNRGYGKEAAFGCIAKRVNHGDIIVWGGRGCRVGADLGVGWVMNEVSRMDTHKRAQRKLEMHRTAVCTFYPRGRARPHHRTGARPSQWRTGARPHHRSHSLTH